MTFSLIIRFQDFYREKIKSSVTRKDTSSPRKKSLRESNSKNSRLLQKTLIRYTDQLLSECGSDTWPEFFNEPNEPAKRTVDSGNYREWIGYGDVSNSPYDTAWLSMVPSKTFKESGSAADFELSFPQCFTWFFEYQKSSGSWFGSGPESIAPDLAGLLSLGLFRSHSGQYFEEKLQELGLSLEQYNDTFQGAVEHLRTTLNEWNIDEIDMVGFELIIPYLLNTLEKLDPPVKFEFPDKSRLLKENARKMGLLPLEAIFALAAKRQPLSIVYSLEALCDKIDMTRVQNEGFQSINGCYGSSPAATAAVILHASKWDNNAYEYLKKVLESRPIFGKPHGHVPGLCDVGIFETLWVTNSLSGIMLNLYEGKYSNRNKMEVQGLLEKSNAFIEYIKALLKEQDCLRWISFDSRIPPDVDDTSVANWIIRKFDSSSECNIDALIKTFYNGKYFITFPAERTFSVSCNAHALFLMILEYEDAKIKGNGPKTFTIKNKAGIEQQVQIDEIVISVTKFIMEQRSNDATWSDKWNRSPAYTTFKAIDILLSLINHPEILKALSVTELDIQRFCRKTVEYVLKIQHEDGSFGESSNNAMGNLEETSYYIRLLKSSYKYWPQDKSIKKCISKGREYLMDHLDEAMNTPGYFHNQEPFLWINKHIYTMPRIIKSSMLMALWKN